MLFHACYQCEQRTARCHASCPAYLNAKEASDMQREKIQAEKKKFTDWHNYKMDQVIAMVSGHHR